MLQGRAPSEGSLSLDSSRVQRELIAQLEAKNKEIVREIKRLKYVFKLSTLLIFYVSSKSFSYPNVNGISLYRIQQELENAALGSDGSSAENPALMSELRALRQRRDELEGHLSSLQDSRRQLMVQLEGLMKLLKVSSYINFWNQR